MLYGAFSRDALLRLAAAGTYRPRWTARIEAEWVAALLATRPDLAPERLVRAFPGAAVMGFEVREPGLALPDPDDRHVPAAAVESGAGEVVTWNLKDFPEAALRPLGVEAVSPDASVGPMMEADPGRVAGVLRRHRTGLLRPPLTAAEYVGYLEWAGLTALVSALRDHGGAS